MSIRYLLPCSNCDHQFEVVATQAGQDLECPKCNTQQEAPKLGQIKQLPTTGDSGSADKSKKGNSILTTLGLLIALVCGGAGGFLYWYGSDMVTDEFNMEEQIEFMNESIDKFSPAEVLRQYTSINADEGLGDWQETTVMRYNNQGYIIKNFSYGIMGLAVVGLLMMIWGFFSKGS